MAVKISPKNLKEVEEHIAKFPKGKQKGAILNILHLAQENFGGWLSVEVMDYVASLLDINPIEVYEVVTFYTMFNQEPIGKHVFEVCQTGPCMLNGSESIVNHIKKRLNIKEGETTSDGLFTLKTVECLGACGYAPVMQKGKTYKEHLTIEKIDKIIDNLKPKVVE